MIKKYLIYLSIYIYHIISLLIYNKILLQLLQFIY